jgi:ATP-binding cassette subfamily B protein
MENILTLDTASARIESLMLLEHFRRLVGLLPAARPSLALVWTGATGWTLDWTGLLLLSGLLPAVQALSLDLACFDRPDSCDQLHRLRVLVAGRTAVMITHRCTTAMHADRIPMLDQGRVSESGTHPELLAARGACARSWTAGMRELDHA